MGMSLTVLLAYSVYLSIITHSLPQTSENVCCLQVFITSMFGITAFSVLLSVLVLNIHHMSDDVQVGEVTKKSITRLRKIICLDRKKKPSIEVKNIIKTMSSLPVKERADVKEKIQSTEDTGRHKCPDKTNVSEGSPPDNNLAGNDDVTWAEVAKTIDRVVFARIVVRKTCM